MQLNHLRYFYEVARTKSFTKASKALFIGQPAVSKLVKQLEYELDVQLLDRFKRGGVSLTETGQLFYEHCQKIFQEVENLKLGIASQSAAFTGELKFGASDSFCNYVLPEVLAAFCGGHPKLRPLLMNGVSEVIKRDLVNSNIEFGLFHRQPTEANLISEKLGFVPFTIVVTPKVKKNKIWSDLPYIGPRVEDYADPLATVSLVRSLGVDVKPHFETNSDETRKRLVLAGCGYTVLPTYMVNIEITSRQLAAIMPKKKMGMPLFLVTKKGRTLSRAATAFVTYLKEHLPIALKENSRGIQVAREIIR